MYKDIILSKIKEYILLKVKHKKSGKMITFTCPFCKKEGETAMLIPNTSKANCVPCQKHFDLVDVVRGTEGEHKESTEEEILNYLKKLLNVDVTTKSDENKLDKLLDFYVSQNFDMVPIVKNKKNPIEKAWTTKNHKEKGEWLQWITNGLNMGVKTGGISNITVIDVDQAEIPKELEPYLKDTLHQKTNKGHHFFFKYTTELSKTRIDEYKIDIENDGGQVVINPSTIDGKVREINCKPIIAMPKELIAIFKKKTTVPLRTNSERIVEDIDKEIYKKVLIKEGEGRNDLFVRFGGILRKQLSTPQVEYSLLTLNKMICYPELSYKEISAMAKSLERYCQFDDADLAHKIIKYLELSEEASKAEIEIAVFGKRGIGEIRQRIDRLLVYLIKEEKIMKKSNGKAYKLVKSMDWKDTLIQMSTPIDFEVPYIDDYARFNWGDFIVIGSQNKYGKTTLAMNIVKKFVDQGIKPYYIYSETGGRFGKTALKLGMKDGDFWHIFCGNPDEIMIEKNSVVIFDWVRPTDGFNKTDELYDKMVQKLQKTQAFMLCFAQLKKNNPENGWFAPNMITQYPALACKYMYEEGSDGTNTFFDITEVRDPKQRGKTFTQSCLYHWDTKVVEKLEHSGE